MRSDWAAVEVRCIVFDFDGVLVDSNALKRNAYFDAFHDVPGAECVIESALLDDRDGDRYDIIAHILRRLGETKLFSTVDIGSEAALARFAERYSRICESGVTMAPEIQGCSDILTRLAESHPLYVNSATPEEPLQRIVARRGWMHFFKGVFGRPRTKTENLNLILRREGIAPGALTFIGDSRHDEAAAKAVGCRFIPFGGAADVFEGHCHAVITDLRDLWFLI